MKIINDKGVVLISLFFLLLGAYYIIYARVLFTATEMVSCFGTDCLTLLFLRILTLILGVIGAAYIILAVIIRFHRVGCYLALVACCFNILLMISYLLRPSVFSLGLTLVFPIRVILSRSLEYTPAQARDFISLLESGFELFIILLNIGIAAYLVRCLSKELWGHVEEEEEEEMGVKELNKAFEDALK
jgi:hypothetical protein